MLKRNSRDTMPNRPKRKKKMLSLFARKSRKGALLAVAAISIGIVGTVLIVLSHAATPPNCSVIQGTNKNLLFCTNITSSNQLYSAALYTADSASDVITSASLTLYRCTTATTPVCSVSQSTNTIQPTNALNNRPNSFMKTYFSGYSSGNIYKTCITFTTTSGLSANNVCTQIVTWGTGATESPRVYQQTTTTIPTTSTTPTNTTTTSTSTNTTTAQAQPAPPATCGSQLVAPKPDGSQWQCTFNDEFEGTALNRTFWNVQTTAGSGFATTDTGNNNPRACFMDTSKNVSVSGGYLHLTAAQEPAAFTCTGTKTPFTTVYTAGEVQSMNKFSQQYGRFEVSAKLPSTSIKGLQETFWLWPNNMTKYGAWPASGEFDFSEFYSKYNNLNVPIAHYLVDTKTVNFTNHLNTYTPVIYYDKNFNNCYINVGAFNTYTAIWRSGYLEVDVNGKPCLVDTYSATNGANPTPFDQPFFLALTQAIGINAGGDNQFVPGTTPLPATTQVDYVRVWK